MTTQPALPQSSVSRSEIGVSPTTTTNLAALASENEMHSQPSAPEADINTAAGLATPEPINDTPCTGGASPVDGTLRDRHSASGLDGGSEVLDRGSQTDPLIEALAKKRGIRPETLIANGIQPHKQGGASDGFILPYWHIDEQGDRIPTQDPPGKQYCRVRRGETMASDQKYTQARGTQPHIYTPFGLEDLMQENPFRDRDGVQRLLIQEGEMKALSVVEAGFPSVGLGGITSFTDGHGALHPELRTAIWGSGIEEVVFIGDTDAAINARFAQAACTMAWQIRQAGLNCKLRAVTLPFSGHPACKGIDDWRRHLLNDSMFEQELMDLIGTAVEVEGAL
jgi:hypothetical protein